MNKIVKKNMKHVAKNQKFSFQTVEEFIDKTDWRAASLQENLTEDFISEFANCFFWKFVTPRYKFSHNFIRKHKDKIVWNQLCEQDFSYKFMQEFGDKLDAITIVFPDETTRVMFYCRLKYNLDGIYYFENLKNSGYYRITEMSEDKKFYYLETYI